MDNKVLPLVYVGIINYNGLKHLSYCIPSVIKLDYKQLFISVIDNASTDESIAFLNINFPLINVIKSNKNNGYTGAANKIIEEAVKKKAKYTLIITNDMILDSRILTYSVKVAEKYPEVAIIGYKIYGKSIFEPISSFEKASDKWVNLKYRQDEGIDGAAMFVQTDIADKIGGFDDKYFMYAEETDFQFRIKKAGFIFMRLNLPIWHNAGQSDEKTSWFISWLSMRNEMRYAIKNFGFKKGLLTFKSLVNRSCNPFLSKEILSQRIIKRSRPSSLIANFIVVLAAFFWNVKNLRKTILIRNNDKDLIEKLKVK